MRGLETNVSNGPGSFLGTNNLPDDTLRYLPNTGWPCEQHTGECVHGDVSCNHCPDTSCEGVRQTNLGGESNESEEPRTTGGFVNSSKDEDKVFTIFIAVVLSILVANVLLGTYIFWRLVL